jgi:hypothetical protein
MWYLWKGTEVSLKLRLKVDAKCPTHPRYNPQKEDRAPSGDFPCAGCDDLYVIHLYSKVIAKRVNHLSGVHPKDTYDYTYKPAAKEALKAEPKAVTEKTAAVEPPIKEDAPAIEGDWKEITPIEEPPKRKRGRPRKEVA